MRLIDADAMMKRLKKWDTNDAIDKALYNFALSRVLEAPTVVPERKRPGHWILNRSGAYCCSECMEPCASYAMMRPRDKFCKMCGAKMEGRDDRIISARL